MIFETATSSILRLLDTLLDETPEILVEATLNASKAATLDHLLVWSITWSIGAALDAASRKIFSDFLIQRLQEHERYDLKIEKAKECASRNGSTVVIVIVIFIT